MFCPQGALGHKCDTKQLPLWWAAERGVSCALFCLYNISILVLPGFTTGSYLMLPHHLCLSIGVCFILGRVFAVLQFHQKQGQPAGRSECFLALMRPECTWSMSTVGLTAQEISFPIGNPFLRGSYCPSMAGSKSSWSYRPEPSKWVLRG